MKRFSILLAVIAGFLLSACHKEGVREEYDASGKIVAREFTGGDPNYSQYIRGAVDLQTAQKPIVSMRARPGETITLGGVESFEVYAPAGGGGGVALAPPQPKPTVMGEFRATVRELTPWVGHAAGYFDRKEGHETTRYVASVNAQRDVAQFNAFAASTSAGYDVLRDIGVAQATNPGTSINVGAGGIYAGGDAQQGDYAGNDLLGAGANTGTVAPIATTITTSGAGNAIGDGNEIINGDNANNSGRNLSPGPYDSSCRPGTFGCNVVIEPADPEPEPEPEIPAAIAKPLPALAAPKG